MIDIARVTAFLTEDEFDDFLTGIEGFESGELRRKLLFPLEQLKTSNPGAIFRLTFEVKR